MKKLIMSLAMAFFGLTAVNAQTGTQEQENQRQEQRGQEDQGMHDQDDQGLQQNDQLMTEDGEEFDVAEKSRISIVELPEEVVNELQGEDFRDMQILEVFELQPQDENQDEVYEIHLMKDDKRKVKHFDSQGNELSSDKHGKEKRNKGQGQGEYDMDEGHGSQN